MNNEVPKIIIPSELGGTKKEVVDYSKKNEIQKIEDRLREIDHEIKKSSKEKRASLEDEYKDLKDELDQLTKEEPKEDTAVEEDAL